MGLGLGAGSGSGAGMGVPLIDVGVSVRGVGSLRVVWVGMRCLAPWFSSGNSG